MFETRNMFDMLKLMLSFALMTIAILIVCIGAAILVTSTLVYLHFLFKDPTSIPITFALFLKS